MNNSVRDRIFAKTNGRCAYCGVLLEKGWHIDHMEPVVRDFEYNRAKQRFEHNGKIAKPENDTFANKWPSCPNCNIDKSSQTLEQYRHSLEDRLRQLQRQSLYRSAVRYGMLTENNEWRCKFYFESMDAQNTQKE